MKKQKFLAILSLILCLGLLFVGCSKKDDKEDEEPEVTLSVEEAKNKVVQAFNGNTNMETLTADLDPMAMLTELLGTDTFEATFPEGAGYLGMKDGYIYSSMNRVSRDGNWIYMNGAEQYVFAQDETGKWVNVQEAGNTPSEPSQGGADSSTVMLTMLEALENVELPELKESDLTEKDGAIVLKNEYLKTVVKEVMNTAMGSVGAPADVMQEYEKMVDSVTDALGLEIAFRMKGTEINKVSLSVDADVQKLTEAVGNTYDGSVGSMKASMEITLTDDAKAVKELKASLDMKDDNETVKTDIDIKPILNDKNVIKGADVTLNMSYPDYKYTYKEDATYRECVQTNLKMAYKLDMTKLNAAVGTTVLDFDMSQTESFLRFEKVTYTADNQSVGTTITEEEATKAGLTKQSSNETHKMSVDGIVAANGTVELTCTEDGEKLEDTITVNVKAAPSFPEVPAEIQAYVAAKKTK